MATMAAMPKKGESSCEVCGGPVEDGALCGCERCGRMYGPCCNSVEDSICVECV
jgi:hypothetical protein